MIGQVGKSNLGLGISFLITLKRLDRREFNELSLCCLGLDGQTDLSPAGPVPALVVPQDQLNDAMAALPRPMELPG